MKRITRISFFKAIPLICLLVIVEMQPLLAKDTLTIRGDRTGRVFVEDGSTGKIVREFKMGPGVIRETFLLQGGKIAVASQAYRAQFWNVQTGDLIRTIEERIYAFTPDESLFVTFVADSGGGLFLRETTTGNLKAKLYEGDLGGPHKIAISPDGSFLAIEFGSAFPLEDNSYPFPAGVLHSKYWVELFDLKKGKLVKEFQERYFSILGEFDVDGKYYYQRNANMLLGGEPYDEGYRFDLQQLKWESTEKQIRSISKTTGYPKSYRIDATINGQLHTIADVWINNYNILEDTQNGRVGCIIDARFIPRDNSPYCCLQFWNFVAHDDWPSFGTLQCYHLMTAPYVDPPKGGYQGQPPQDSHPRYNQAMEGQFEFHDMPSMPNTLTSGYVQFETSLGIEGGLGSAHTYTIPGDLLSAFQWGYTWDENTAKVDTIPLQISKISNLNRQFALLKSCFTDWSVLINTPEDPCIKVFLPTATNTAKVGQYTKPKNFKIEVRIGPAFEGRIVKGLRKNNFKTKVGGIDGEIVSVKELSNKYLIEVTPPDKNKGIPANGLYDLEINCTYDYFIGIIKTAVYSKVEEDAVLYGETPAEIITVLDRSGSMGPQYSNYIIPAKNAATQFVSYMNIDDKVGVVSFADNATVNYPLTLITSPSIISAAQSAIANIFANGATSIGSGIIAAKNQFLINGSSDNAQAVILLSDGMENTPPTVATALFNFPSNINIYTIALGPESDQGLLQSIAAQTGGQYFLSPGANELLGIYNLIRGSVSGQQTVVFTNGQLYQSDTVSVSAMMDNTISQAIFSTGWQGSELALMLTRPDGSIIDPSVAASDTSIEFVQGATFKFYKVNSPASGTWKLNMEDVYHSTLPIDYTATVNAETNLTVDAQFYSDTYEAGQPITLLMSLVEGNTTIRNATVRVTVQAPFSSLHKWKQVAGDLVPNGLVRVSVADTVYLYDDGIHGDGDANDGVYGNFYLNTQTSGSYVFHIDISGKTNAGIPFTRVMEKSIFLNPVSGQGEISGKVVYNGRQQGQIYVRAWIDEPERNSIPDYIISFTDSLYLLNGLLDGNYSLDAFMDVDGDFGRDVSEPYGSLDSLLLVFGSTNIQGIDIILEDPNLTIAVSPNPFVPKRGHVQVSFFGAGLPFAKIKIYNKAGEQVRTLEESQGRDRLDWDAKDDGGANLASGVYIWVASNQYGKNQKGKFAIIK